VLETEKEENVFLRESVYLPIDTASRPRRLGISARPLRTTQISHISV
jgi:hypothetical protein